MVEVQAATTAASRNDQRHVVRADHEAATTATATTPGGHPGAADRNLQELACSQAEIAADLGPAASRRAWKCSATPALCAKGKDLVLVGGRYREGDKASRVGEA